MCACVHAHTGDFVKAHYGPLQEVTVFDTEPPRLSLNLIALQTLQVDLAGIFSSGKNFNATP